MKYATIPSNSSVTPLGKSPNNINPEAATVHRPALTECVKASIALDSCRENKICERTLEQLTQDKEKECASNY